MLSAGIVRKKEILKNGGGQLYHYVRQSLELTSKQNINALSISGDTKAEPCKPCKPRLTPPRLKILTQVDLLHSRSMIFPESLEQLPLLFHRLVADINLNSKIDISPSDFICHS